MVQHHVIDINVANVCVFSIVRVFFFSIVNVFINIVSFFFSIVNIGSVFIVTISNVFIVNVGNVSNVFSINIFVAVIKMFVYVVNAMLFRDINSRVICHDASQAVLSQPVMYVASFVVRLTVVLM
jgi:hypothetical protein